MVAAQHGTNLAVLTGNSMDALCDRFLRWLIQHLCFTGNLNLLSQFHFFSNLGGIYAHFPRDGYSASDFPGQQGNREHDPVAIYDSLTHDGPSGRAIRPHFLDASHIERCGISSEDVNAISEILTDVSDWYYTSLVDKKTNLARLYELEKIQDDSRNFIKPHFELRAVQYGLEPYRQATVQITFKPVLSFRHAKAGHGEGLVAKDVRTQVARRIQQDLDRCGLSYFIARCGGTSSIDITLEKVDKAYALEFLIDRLNLQGASRLGEKFGANTIYFGDEVVSGGGNDYAVTRIPGLLVFAVNSDRNLVPFLSSVFVPSTTVHGPSATADVLEDYNRCANELSHLIDPQQPGKTVIDALKEKVFSSRIKQKIEQLHNHHHSARDWETLHALVTLMCRKDPGAKEWLAMLADEMGRVMALIAAQRLPLQSAIGASHPDHHQSS